MIDERTPAQEAFRAADPQIRGAEGGEARSALPPRARVDAVERSL